MSHKVYRDDAEALAALRQRVNRLEHAASSTLFSRRSPEPPSQALIEERSALDRAIDLARTTRG